MKYDINYSCGHMATVQLYGSEQERERKIEWLKTQTCPECQKAERQKEYAAENTQARARSNEMGLPKITGTDKQTAWAESIRIKCLDAIDTALKDDADRFSRLSDEDKKQYRQAHEAGKEKMNLFSSWLLSHVEAKWWIENRDTPMKQMMKTFQAYSRYTSVYDCV